MARFLCGILVGAILVIGGAYVRDVRAMQTAKANGAPPLPIVNWEQITAAFGGR